jgi:arylsulfatase A-like enzyme
MRVLGLAGAVALVAGTAMLASFNPRPETVVFVVLDTVRADHTSLCGYERDTTPTLVELVEAGASHTCRAYAPGSWTLPSHASFFTGLAAHEHQADNSSKGEPPDCDGLVCDTGDGYFIDAGGKIARGMPKDVPTLAVRFRERGYQSVSVAGNPIVSPVSGLTRGFEVARAPRWFGELYGDVQLRELERVLDQLDPDRPLFLFLNIADAHDPWDPPSGSGERLAYYQPENDPLEAVLSRSLSPQKEAELLAKVRDYYDAGVRRADWVLRRSLEALRRRGWLSHYRLVVTSDHGEFVGEHGLLTHGMFLWEQNQRVPLLYLDSRGRPPLDGLEGPVSALQAHQLVLNGRLTDVPVVASGRMTEKWTRLSGGRLTPSSWAVAWQGRDKLAWVNGRTSRYDVLADPMEENPLPAGDLRHLARIASWRDRAVSQVDEDLAAMLRSLGYAD